ncbi:Dol-P-Man:Man(7)GlcNAc(2)-PP-Dol alpha-1,6-mannosyltransferase [Striga asiatica]|uniref:Mannosyltransferase n=1 Tax=Striga asiatica TaxID=4170 RepID=A0A5A7QD79_STRAF|nr:Dol-P-Man:Man(7)GlcNAc(2)-PP-Dol alpha-1,6-mannosyltransferase [Striga asiatica]
MALNSKFMHLLGYDVLLGSVAAIYVFMAPYTKVEESFNVQYDHLDFPGVVPRTFIGALIVSILSCPFAIVASLLQLPKIYSLYAGFTILYTLRFFRIQIRKNFGSQVEAFFVILTAIQFHTLFYCTRPLPNILAFGLGKILSVRKVNLAYGYWFKQSFYAALNSLVLATIIFRCDILLLAMPLGLELLLSRTISLPKALLTCGITVLFCIGLTVLVDSLLWRRLLWPELETHAFHWYFTSALPRSLLAAYPLFVVSHVNYSKEVWVHIDTFSAINGISRFCENGEPWREHELIHGYKCLFSIKGFSGLRVGARFPPVSLVKSPKVFVHGNLEYEEIYRRSWPGC